MGSAETICLRKINSFMFIFNIPSSFAHIHTRTDMSFSSPQQTWSAFCPASLTHSHTFKDYCNAATVQLTGSQCSACVKTDNDSLTDCVQTGPTTAHPTDTRGEYNAPAKPPSCRHDVRTTTVQICRS